MHQLARLVHALMVQRAGHLPADVRNQFATERDVQQLVPVANGQQRLALAENLLNQDQLAPVAPGVQRGVLVLADDEELLREKAEIERVEYCDETCATGVANTLFAGDTVHVESEVVAARESKSRPGQGIVTFEHRAYNQHDELVCRARRGALMHKRPESVEA